MKRGAGELFATHRIVLIEHVIDPMDDGFSLDDIYHALDIIAEHQDAIDEFCMRQIPLNGCVREAGCCLYLRHTLSFLLQLQNHITDDLCICLPAIQKVAKKATNTAPVLRYQIM